MILIRISAFVIINAPSGSGNSDSVPFNCAVDSGRMDVTVL